ncbi:hypothetical protein KA047_03925 [Candidatus Saccharibacteria bacterium]|nr:hypothetical protein [Candidatus Saccharibacteria bacterium]
MKKDAYSEARGGWSRIIDVTCEKCDDHICLYQKDGPGPLKRMYVDRMINLTPKAAKLICQGCDQELGIKMVYVKENRAAYRLFQNSVNKKVVKKSVAIEVD